MSADPKAVNDAFLECIKNTPPEALKAAADAASDFTRAQLRLGEAHRARMDVFYAGLKKHNETQRTT